MTLGEAQMQTHEADGWSLRCLINPKGIGKRIVVDRQKVKTSSEFRRYRRAGRFEVRAGRMVRQAGTESRPRKGQNWKRKLEKGEKAKQENGKKTLVGLDMQDKLVQRNRKHRDKYTGTERQETQG
jgi:uncharacterized short protein YbdD (DUF466 family)